jgi:hypothetical protein
VIDEETGPNAADDEGWVQLDRKLMNSAAWTIPELWKVFCWCLMRASYVARRVQVSTGRGVTQQELHVGQFIFGRNAAAKELGMPAESVRNRMGKLAEFELIKIEPATHYSIVTVLGIRTCGSDADESGHPLATQRPSNGQPLATNKKVNKGNKDKKIPCDEAAERPASLVAYPVFPCVPGKRSNSSVWKLTDEYLAELKSAYPAVQVEQQCRAAHLWIIANPTRRKTAGGMANFLLKWMSRCQDRGGYRIEAANPESPYHDAPEQRRRLAAGNGATSC